MYLDAEGNEFVAAIAHVESESTENWRFLFQGFVQKFEATPLCGLYVAINVDLGPGLLSLLQSDFPEIPIHCCVQHREVRNFVV